MPDTKDNGTQRRDGRDFGGHGRAMSESQKDQLAKSTKKLKGEGGLTGKAMRAARKRKELLDSI